MDTGAAARAEGAGSRTTPRAGTRHSLDLLHVRVTDWFTEAARDLPWREQDCSAWGILVSEIMLQQTPVVRVLPVWREWLERWPTASHLAAEPPGAAVRHWGRLGYPRRALRLHAAAVAITEEHGGEVPATHDDLLTLPGVGAYTAAAVAAFAFGRRQTVVDTNIRRVHARLFTGTALPAPALTAAEMKRAASLLPDDAGLSVRWNAAVMELGAVICTARNPACGHCPVADACAWVEAGRPAPEYVPKGQSWAGTDRQVRGAIVAVLRESDGAVPRVLLLEAPAGLRMDPAAAVTARPGALGALHGLRAPAEQLDRALAGLLADGLAEEHDGGIRLPG
ncbi:A/G-specific adenine glycosylase [Arthrobacter agilis]|uniref:A/G-specific adenine glycosylase n=1 Tax=Arthrobacter agilis TaxID=37921 RepID=UPI002365C46D|nr:A/G-specific adenine glycosylase [Arthrobacter agilis]WDF33474.1 A/G-specific adenine glycosylase [Arthrobacter agilis]